MAYEPAPRRITPAQRIAAAALLIAGAAFVLGLFWGAAWIAAAALAPLR